MCVKLIQSNKTHPIKLSLKCGRLHVCCQKPEAGHWEIGFAPAFKRRMNRQCNVKHELQNKVSPKEKEKEHNFNGRIAGFPKTNDSRAPGFSACEKVVNPSTLRSSFRAWHLTTSISSTASRRILFHICYLNRILNTRKAFSRPKRQKGC